MIFQLPSLALRLTLGIELNKFISNAQTNVHYFQLIWLLSTFISSCQDYGVNPYILCKE